MNIAVIDADLVGRKKHRFPNLATMKISGYYKEQGNNVILKMDYNNLDVFDKVFISKAFTDTPIDNKILELPNVEYGGTGFFYDKAPKLPEEVEQHKPDYDLYKSWVENMIAQGKKRSEFKYYLDYSIGYLTRGCFRHCKFCVNQNSNGSRVATPLSSFYDSTKKKIALLDDNFLACAEWKELLLELKMTNKPVQFNQGLDERLLTNEKIELLHSLKYDGDYTFAFDNIEDKDVIISKLQMMKEKAMKRIKFYVLCGFDKNGSYNDAFWIQDIKDTFERVSILRKEGVLPYIMRFAAYDQSPYRGIYINLARWCNQPSLFKTKTFREFCIMNGLSSACYRYMQDFEKSFPELAEGFYDLRWNNA